MEQTTEQALDLSLHREAIRDYRLAGFKPGDVVKLPSSPEPHELHIVVGMIWMKSITGWMYFLAQADTLNAIVSAKYESELWPVSEVPEDNPQDSSLTQLTLDIDNF